MDPNFDIELYKEWMKWFKKKFNSWPLDTFFGVPNEIELIRLRNESSNLNASKTQQKRLKIITFAEYFYTKSKGNFEDLQFDDLSNVDIEKYWREAREKDAKFKTI